MDMLTQDNTFAYATPYAGQGITTVFNRFSKDLYGCKINGESHFKDLISLKGLPDIMIMGNFPFDRAGIISICRHHNINVVHTEDGFFPHSGTRHFDPLGFCWESSLPRLLFRSLKDKGRLLAQAKRQEWLSFQKKPLPPCIKKPFVLWPLQLIRDKVNLWGLNVASWIGLIRHFRECLPAKYQLVIKEHPLCSKNDNREMLQLASELPHSVWISRNIHLKSLIAESCGMAGANSTSLYEARLMFQKPVYVYAQSWFTNHEELFLPVPFASPISLPRFDYVENNRLLKTERLNDYADWFLAHLLSRQIEDNQLHSSDLKSKIDKLSYKSYVKYGDDVFV
jgi:hypothetical protein